MERKLVAVVAGDVVGYSRRMAEDETATYAELRTAFDGVVGPVVEEHAGRVCKTTGDGFIAAFGNTGDALAAAIDIQQRMAGQPLEFRIGINLGEVIEEDGDLFGDDVNVAVRLQTLAEPGAICASASLVRSADRRAGVQFRRIGRRQVKNIPGRLEVFEVLVPGRSPSRAPRIALGRAAAAVAVLVAVGGLGLWSVGEAGLIGPAGDPLATMSNAAVAVAARDQRPSVAVLPFDNFGDASQSFFSDGLTEDVIAALARSRDLAVLARNATFGLGNAARDVRAVGARLGADYVVQGSARRSGDRLRVVAQLIDAKSGANLWSRDYDRRLDDVFEVQADLTDRIVASLVSYVRRSESAAAAARPPGDARAYELVLQARSRFPHGSKDAVGMLAARDLYRRAIALDPGYAAAHAHLGLTYIADHVDRGGDADPAGLETGLASAREAVRLEPDLALGYQVLSFGLAVNRDYQASLIAAERATELTPSDPDSLMALAKAQVRFGSYDAAVGNAERARRLHPIAPAYYAFVHGQALYASGRTEEAERVLAECMLATPRDPNCLRIRISALTRLGRTEEARARMGDLVGADPGFSLASERIYQRFGDSPLMKAYLADLSAAGAPETSARMM